MHLSDVVKNLLIINVIAYIVTHLTGEFGQEWLIRLSVFYPSSAYFEPYQIVTYMFMHGNVTHIFFNMFALYMFGTPIEMAWGPKRFLFYYLFTGFGALVLQFLVQFIALKQGWEDPESINYPMLGASGAVFGLLAAYGMQFPNSILQLIIPPVRMKAKYFVIIYAALELFLGVSGFQTGVAHFAHLGGALFGILIILYWRQKGERLY
ncbi:MAG: rhomboid family intramembrane serine protease [Lewinellaceae bacterium]|nr:rhomboid family intramembrane serine protease [Saprospiraceae bacterium]MCB9338496.1 rhomboid family intramembrane serine protease [Lewinellaceae bacterium]